ncbi:HI0074 family nucleotidyltransferase substrate-binding subunit, partial [Patescibacteria group bacterium]
IRDSVIKRFEYCFESCWKTSKVFLNDKFGVEVFSPKKCFRELRRNGLITDEETEMFLEMTDNRNEIIHTYNESFSDEIYDKISDRYYELLKGIYNILKVD